MKWVTRHRPKIDRIACPWLIQRFVDKNAEFLFVPPDRVMDTANRTSAIPYDVEGVELTHDGPLCSFDAILKKYALTDPALVIKSASKKKRSKKPRPRRARLRH